MTAAGDTRPVPGGMHGPSAPKPALPAPCVSREVTHRSPSETSVQEALRGESQRLCGSQAWRPRPSRSSPVAACGPGGEGWWQGSPPVHPAGDEPEEATLGPSRTRRGLSEPPVNGLLVPTGNESWAGGCPELLLLEQPCVSELGGARRGVCRRERDRPPEAPVCLSQLGDPSPEVSSWESCFSFQAGLSSLSLGWHQGDGEPRKEEP